MSKKSDVIAAPVDEKSADQILKEIEAEQRQLDAKAAKPEQEPEPVSKSDQTIEPQSSDKPPQEEATSEPPATGDPAGSHKVETTEWMKKKGLKDVNDLERYLRNLDRQYHRSRKEEKEKETQVASAPVQQPLPPQYGQQTAPVSLQELAKYYGVHPDDMKTIIRLVDDASEVKLRRQLQPIMDEFTSMKRDMTREHELQELKSEPHFKSRDVQEEMGKILEADPSIWGREARPVRYAYEMALSNIGRRFVESSNQDENPQDESRTGIPKTPPPAGKGSATGVKGVSIKSLDDMTPEKFEGLSLADQEKYLKSKGAFQKLE